MNFNVFFQLIRWKNLLIIFSIQALIQFVLISKIEQNLQLSNLNFLFLLFSTLFIASAGYIINDIYDINIDAINKADNLIINKYITLKQATILYTVLNLAGLILGIWLSIRIEQPYLILYFTSIISLLFIYSNTLKSTPLIGNIIVGVLASSSLLIFLFFESINSNALLFKYIVSYSIFAFIINLIGEIIKDIEDINGDAMGNISTLPILIGRKRTQRISIVLSILLTSTIVTTLVLTKELGALTKIYGSIFTVTPLTYFISKLYSAKSKKDYHKLSTLLKTIMILGMLSIFTL